MLRTLLMLALLARFVAPALAAPPPPPATPPPAASLPAASPPAASLSCPTAPAVSVGAPSSTVIEVAPDTAWRPEGSEVRFTIASTQGAMPTITQVLACFRWQTTRPDSDTSAYTPTPLIRSISTADGKIEYGAIIPSLVPPSATGMGQARPQVVRTALRIVPVAEMVVLVRRSDSLQPVQVILPVGITNVRLAGFIVLVCIIVFGAILWSLAPPEMLDTHAPRWQRISEHMLAVIANPEGIASLSQFQVMLWTLVVAGSAVYVMVLSGNLIPISAQMLTLLGIAGGTQILASVDRVKPPAGTPYPPPAKPEWSQMLVDKYSCDIDVTRVQMFIFTLITAVFVAVQVIATYSIPTIDDNFMVLMGISNGVYLAGRKTAAPPSTRPTPETVPAAQKAGNVASGAQPTPGA